VQASRLDATAPLSVDRRGEHHSLACETRAAAPSCIHPLLHFLVAAVPPMPTQATNTVVSPPSVPSHLTPASHVRSARRGDDTILLDLASGQYFTLTGTAARVWALIAEGNDAPRIPERLRAEFVVPVDAPPDLVERDVAALVADLLARGLVVRSPVAHSQPFDS
jgi:hypothetical protein